MIFRSKNVFEAHKWFAWRPVRFINRVDFATPTVQWAFLRVMTRKALSQNGVIGYEYSKPVK